MPEEDSITQREMGLWEPQDQSHRIAGCNALAVWQHHRYTSKRAAP